MVILGYVHGGNTCKEFEQSLDALKRHDKGPQGRNVIGGEADVRGLYVADNRNNVCERFLAAQYPDGSKPEWLFFLDTDVVFTPEQFYAILDAAEPIARPIVGALYFGWLDGKPEPVWRKRHPQLDTEWGTLGEFRIGTLEPIDAVGMGFTVIHRSVLEGMPPIPGDNWRWFGHDLSHGKRLGEDLTFCARAAAHGFSTWGDSRIVVGHVKPLTITLDVFKRYHTLTPNA